MPRKEVRNPNRMQFQNKGTVASYIQAKQIMEDRLWKIVGTKLITFFNGEWLSENELRERLPILSQPCLLSNPDNPNRKKNWSL
jgi:hypothetical protein